MPNRNWQGSKLFSQPSYVSTYAKLYDYAHWSYTITEYDATVFEPRHEKTCVMLYAKNKDADPHADLQDKNVL